MDDFNHIYSELASIILETLSPTRCAACDMPGAVLCASCANALPFIESKLACPRCGAPFGYLLCTECPQPGSEEAREHPEHAFPFTSARCALSFEGRARRLVRVYKDQDELRLDTVIASLLCATMRGRTMRRELAGGDATCARAQRVPDDWTQWADALAYVPASPEAVLRRDFDHMERIARICARRTGLPLLEGLVAGKGARDQRKLGRLQRRENRRSAFALQRGSARVPAKVLLIDDVFTTGATLSAATEVLLEAGCREVRVVTCCRVW